MRKWYPVILIAGALSFSAIAYPHLPLSMPMHWGINGQPNGYGSRLVGAFLMPLIALAIWGFMRGLPLIDPRRANYAKFQGTYDLVVDAVITLLVAVHVAVIGAALGWPIRIDRVMPVVVGGMLLLLGNVMPRARSNWWFGIRTPWTLSSDTVWTKTHRVGGYLMTAAGIVTVLSVVLPARAGFVVLMSAVMGASLGSVVYSYFAWKGEQT
ncbi:MAG: SdpI family protein [Gemmatimonadaceae bacterium]|nr:SdpI family protein [Gemmatimonadaceae bacterium]